MCHHFKAFLHRRSFARCGRIPFDGRRELDILFNQPSCSEFVDRDGPPYIFFESLGFEDPKSEEECQVIADKLDELGRYRDAYFLRTSPEWYVARDYYMNIPF